jgi:guanylate kinase
MQSKKVIIITAPSGAGKTTVVNHLLGQFPLLAFSVSATTRKKRLKESEGREYYFMPEHEFKQKIANNEFAEWEEVYPGIFYGTLKNEIERLWNEGKIIVFDVDVKGALNLKDQFANNSLSVYIKPPSAEVVAERLKKRGTENDESLLTRVGRIKMETQFENKFDKIILNSKLDTALEEACKTVRDFIEV